jgi:Porphyromonas-type peptidyl-arginine deiminase
MIGEHASRREGNGVVLVPQYHDPEPDLDRVAVNAYRDALPDWKVVGIDCSKLIVKRGALNAKFPHSAIGVSIEAGSPGYTMVSEFKRICPRPDARGRSMPQVS